MKKSCSYSQWASAIGRLTGCSVSKQSLFERLGPGASAFAESLLRYVMKKKINKPRDVDLFGRFKKVLLQDSTTLSLPDSLAKYFPGNISRGVQKAVARIQCIIELTSMHFMHFSLSGFTNNDQSASSLVDAYLQKDDLIIRDLGYFVLSSLQRIADKQAYFLSRLRYNVKIYDRHGACLPLRSLLRRHRPVDQWVWLGKKQQLPVRLLIIPLPDAQAAERKRKARKDRDRRLNHSKTYYQWLGYAVFVTNVAQEVWTARQVTEAYKIRWQMEIIFKSWKSGFNLQCILQEQYRNVHRIVTAIFLMLLFICLFMQKIYLYYKKIVGKKKSRIVSLYKLSKYASANLLVFFDMNRNQLVEQIARHCCYENRPDRTNMTDLINFLKLT